MFFSGKEARGKDDAGQDSFGLMLKDTLRVKRIINNNIVLAEDFKGHEVVAIGKGLGFRKQKYDGINSREVMKTYVLVDGSARPQLLSLFEQVPFEIIELTQRIIDIAQEDLKMTFNVNLVVALADHIQFSVNQYKAGFDMPALVNEEVKRFYKDEYEVGKKAVRLINETLHIQLKREESTSIAFHLITAAEKRPNHDALRIMQGVSEIIKLVEQTLGLTLDEDSMAVSRFIIHLKFFMRSILFEQVRRSEGSLGSMLSQFSTGYEQASRCVDLISNYVLKHYDYSLTDEDRLYLMIHVVRLWDQPGGSHKA